jgi:hypothetical protein
LPPSEQERALSPEPTRPPETPSSERRRTPRAKPAGLSYVKLEPDNGGRLLDVCESGIGFQVVAPIEETKRIQLWFVLDSANHIEVSGELAWIDDTKRSGGLKFTRPSKQARQQLRAWLSHQRTESANEQQPEPARRAPAAQSQHLSHESEFERELHSLPHTDPAPLESLLDTILTSLQTSPPEDLFSRPAPTEIQAQEAIPEIEASGLVEKMAQEHAASAPPIAPLPIQNSAPARAPKRISATPAVPQPPASRPRSPRRNLVPRSNSASQTSDAIARAVGFNSGNAERSEKSSDVKYAQFRMAVDRVSGMLTTLRHAIAADDSDWPLTAIADYEPAAAAPVELPKLATPQLSGPIVSSAPSVAAPIALPVAAQVAAPMTPPLAANVEPAKAHVVEPIESPAPIAFVAPINLAAPVEAPAPILPTPKIAEPESTPVAMPESPSAVDVRPWSAGAPWKAAESPAASPSWMTTLPSRLSDFTEAAFKSTASRILQASDAFGAAWSKFARNARVTGAGIFTKTASLASAAKTSIAPMLARTGSASLAAALRSARTIRAATAASFAKLKPAVRSARTWAQKPITSKPRAAQPVTAKPALAIAPAAIAPAARATQPAALIAPAIPAAIAPVPPPAQPAIPPTPVSQPAPASAALSASTPVAQSAPTPVAQSTPAFTVLEHPTALDNSREKLATASKEIQRATSNALFKMIPREPTLGEMAAMLAITAVLIVGLVTFNYRDKLSAWMDSFGDDSALARPTTSPEPAPTKKKSSGRVLKTRRNGAAQAGVGSDAEREDMPRPSTREMTTALAYLNNNRGQRDATTAAQWLWAASRKGDTGANIVLADLYIRGDGVQQNCAQARVLLLAASKKGNETATQKLQQLDATGCATPTP